MKTVGRQLLIALAYAPVILVGRHDGSGFLLYWMLSCLHIGAVSIWTLVSAVRWARSAAGHDGLAPEAVALHRRTTLQRLLCWVVLGVINLAGCAMALSNLHIH